MNLRAGTELPPFGVIGPYLLGAPLGLVLAGIMLMRADATVFLSPTVQPVVAATHATVLGWLTLAMMGAMLQLGVATAGGRLRWLSIARIQWALHVVGVATFVIAVDSWNVPWMSVAGVALCTSFVLFIVNAVPAIRWSLRGSSPGTYFSVALGFLAVTGGLGITYVGTLEHAWFPLTLGRIAGHAHLGLLGWVSIVIMGAAYQMLPMFQLSHAVRPRFALWALWVTAVAAVAGSLVLMADPSPPVRGAVAVGYSLGPVLWASDMVRLISARARRTADLQLRATLVSLGFLAAAIPLGFGAALGHDMGAAVTAPRLQLAYGIVVLGGWAGTTLVGNSFKIVPFLVWYWRYRELAGRQPVPMVADLTNSQALHAVLALHILAVCVLAFAAISANLHLLAAGAALLSASGLAQFSVLLSVMVRRPQPRTTVQIPEAVR